MDYQNNNNTDFDAAGFEAFFKTHPHDATVAEELPPDETNEGADNAGTPDGASATSDTSDTNNSVKTDDTATTDDGDATNKDGADNTQSVNKAVNQQAQAFAQMRIANKQQQQLINQIAQVVGVANTSDPNAVMTALQNLVIKAQSQKQGIPEEVLSRLNTLEASNQEYQKQQAYLAAGRGFHNIKEKFELDDDALESFARELIADGINPYEQVVDLMSEYRNRHFDELIEQAVQRGIAQEAKRAAKAGAQSSTPGATVGASDDSETPKINSVAELNKWLEENK